MTLKNCQLSWAQPVDFGGRTINFRFGRDAASGTILTSDNINYRLLRNIGTHESNLAPMCFIPSVS